MPLQILAEKTCQALGVDGRSPISLERYQRAVADCDSFAAWLSDYQAQVTAVKNATLQGFLEATGAAVQSCPLPSLYSERYQTHELKPLPHAPPPKGYAHLFVWPDAAAAPAGAASTTSQERQHHQHQHMADTALQTEKFEGLLEVPIELWLQAHKEAQARLAALDKLRAKVDAQRQKLHKQGQQFERKLQQRKLRSGANSSRSSFEKRPAAALASPAAATSSIDDDDDPTPGRGGSSTSIHAQASPAALAAAAAAFAAGGQGDAAAAAVSRGSSRSSSNNSRSSASSGSFSRSTGAADAGLLSTPPCTPMPSATGFAAASAAAAAAAARGADDAKVQTLDGSSSSSRRTAGAAAGRANDSRGRTGRTSFEGSAGWGQGSADMYAEGLVRLRSFPLVDAPTSVASSSGSRRNSTEQLMASRTPAAADSPDKQQPTLHSALPVPSSALPTAATAAAPKGHEAAAVRSAQNEEVAAPEAAVPAATPQAEGTSGLAGVEDDGGDEESWAAAVLHRHKGEQGLLQAHEAVERALGPLLSEFSKEEMKLSTLLGWLVTQAGRLRAYLNHILLEASSSTTPAGSVGEGWSLPPGLLEPFPADVVLRGAAGSSKHRRLQQETPTSSSAGPLGGGVGGASTTSPPTPAGPPKQLPRPDTPVHSPAAAAPAAAANTNNDHTVQPPGSVDGVGMGSSSSSPAVANASVAADLPAGVSQPEEREGVLSSEAAPAAPLVLVAPHAAVSAAVDSTAEADGAAADGNAALPAAVAPASTAATPAPSLPKPASTSTLSVGSAMLAAMVRSLSWKSSGNVSVAGLGLGRTASRASSGNASGPGGLTLGCLGRSMSRASSNGSGPGAALAARSMSGASSGSGSGAAHNSGSSNVVSPGVDTGRPLGEGVQTATSPRADGDTAQQQQPVESVATSTDAQQAASIATAATTEPAAAGGLSAPAAAVVVPPGSVAERLAVAAGLRAHSFTLGNSAAIGRSPSSSSIGREASGRGAGRPPTPGTPGIPSTSTAAVAATAGEGASGSPGAATTPAPAVAGPEHMVSNMAYLSRDTALINSLSERELCQTCHTTATEPAAAGGTSTGVVGAEAGGDAGAAAASMRAGMDSPAGADMRMGLQDAASATGVSPEVQHKHEQLLQRAAELDAEAESHSAAAAEAARLAVAAAAEALQIEGMMQSEVTVERTRLEQRQEAIIAELSALESTRLSQLREAAAGLDREVKGVAHHLEGLRLQEEEADARHTTLSSTFRSITAALDRLETQRLALQEQTTQAQERLAGKQEEARLLQEQVTQLQAELDTAQAGRSQATSRLEAVRAESAAGYARLSKATSELETHRAELHTLLNTRLPEVEQQLHTLQARLVGLREGETRSRLEGQLSDAHRQIAQDQMHIAALETTWTTASTRLSELSGKATRLSCDTAAANAQVVAARGMQRAEEARATAAAAEAQALKEAAAAMATSVAPVSVTPTAAPASAAVPNRLAEAGPLQQVAGPSAAAADIGATATTTTATSDSSGAARTAAAVASLSGRQPQQEEAEHAAASTHDTQQHAAVVDEATQTPGADVRSAAGDVAVRLQQHSSAAESTGVQQTTPGPLAAAGEAPATAVMGAGGVAAPTAAGAAPAAGRSERAVSTSAEAAATAPHHAVVPGSQAHTVADTVPAAADGLEPPATVTKGPVETQMPAAAATTPSDGAVGTVGGVGAGGVPLQQEIRPDAAAVAAAWVGPLTATEHTRASSSSTAAGGGPAAATAAAVPASPGSVASVASSGGGRSRRHKWLKHYKTPKPEEHFYLPLGGQDMGMRHLHDQTAALTASSPAQSALPAPASPLPAAAEGGGGALVLSSSSLADSSGAAAGTAGGHMLRTVTAVSDMHYVSERGGPMGGRRDGFGGGRPAGAATLESAPHALPVSGAAAGGPMGGVGVGGQGYYGSNTSAARLGAEETAPVPSTALVVAAAAPVGEYESGGAGYGEGAHMGHVSRKQRRAEAVAAVAAAAAAGEGTRAGNGGLGGRGGVLEAAGGYVPGPLEAAGGRWGRGRRAY